MMSEFVGSSSQAPIISLRIVKKTSDELVCSDSARVGLFFGIVIVAFCVLSTIAVLVFGLFVTRDQLAIYYQAFFGPFLVFSGMLFVVGIYLLLSFSEKRLLFSKSS